jgi:K+-sensing histidine kinase KdpD
VSKPGDAERLRRLQLVTDAAFSHLEIDELLAELLTRIRDALDADTAAVLLRDEFRNELVARAAVGLDHEVEQGVRIPIGQGFAGRIAAERRPVVINDLATTDVLSPILRAKGVKSMLGVPLVFANELLGVLHVGSLRPRVFTPGDIELLEVVADRVALAIEHTRLYESERRARERLEQVQTVIDAALAHLDEDALLDEMLRRIRDILDADTAAFLMLDEISQEVVARAAIGLEEEVERGVRIPLGKGFAGRIAAERRPVVLDDVDHADIVNPILREKGIKSMLGVPLLIGDSVLGVLHVGTIEPRLFSRDDQELLELVASRVALAIEKAQLREEMVHLDQMKLNFVAVASHELRTPATSVYGIVATLRERGDTLPDDVREELEETLWDQSVRLRRLIEQLLDLSRLDASEVSIEPQMIELHGLVSQVALETAGSADVRVDIPEDLEVRADRLAIERIFANLVGNALRHGAPPVVVRAYPLDTFLRVSVEDDGQGVPDELVPRLFERFERGSTGQGSGLGLSIAQAYARAHGGDLFYDQSESGGARFELILPRN